MSDPHSHSHPKLAPSLPIVTDEAADSPGWVPVLGFGLFAVIALAVVARMAMGPVAAAPSADDAAAAAAAPTAEAAAPAPQPSAAAQ